MGDRVFTVEDVRRFATEAAARETERAGSVTTEAGRSLIRRSRVVIGKDRAVITVTDGDVLDDICAIEDEARAVVLRGLDELPWAEFLHDLDGVQHYVTHEVGYDGDDVEGVVCITGLDGHSEDADDIKSAVLAALATDDPA